MAWPASCYIEYSHTEPTLSLNAQTTPRFRLGVIAHNYVRSFGSALRVLLLIQLIELCKVDDEVDNEGGGSQGNKG